MCTQEESKKQTTLVEGLLFKTIYDLCFESKNSPVHYLAIEGNLLILKTLVSLTTNKHLHIVEYLFIAIQSLLRDAIAENVICVSTMLLFQQVLVHSRANWNFDVLF